MGPGERIVGDQILPATGPEEGLLVVDALAVPALVVGAVADPVVAKTDHVMYR